MLVFDLTRKGIEPRTLLTVPLYHRDRLSVSLYQRDRLSVPLYHRDRLSSMYYVLGGFLTLHLAPVWVYILHKVSTRGIIM